MSGSVRVLTVLAAMVVAVATVQEQRADAQAQPQTDAFRFSSGVELVNVTATVSDSSGRFVPGLRNEDFVVYEDDKAQTVTQFSAERVPVSLGVVVDTSGSMAGEKILAARKALNRFLGDLLDPQDDLFLYRFSDDPVLMQNWTTDRRLLVRAVDRLVANGGTAMYDAVAEAVPLAGLGQHRKRALVIISDGNDTSSRTKVPELKQIIRESDVLAYAIGIDAESRPRTSPTPQTRRPWPFPGPFPRGRGGRWPQPMPPPIGGTGGGPPSGARLDERVNVLALREMTDDSGGRTEIIRTGRDLDPATTGIADELSRQYYLGYPTSGVKDGRWHEIRVEVRNSTYRVRARRGYFAN